MRKYVKLRLSLGLALFIVLTLFCTVVFHAFWLRSTPGSRIINLRMDPIQAQFYLGVFNQLGVANSNQEMFYRLVGKSNPNEAPMNPFISQMISRIEQVEDRIMDARLTRSVQASNLLIEAGSKIYLASVVCGDVNVEMAAAMLRSAAFFSQDSALHVIIFTSDQSLFALFEQIVELKWTLNVLGLDFTFEMHLEEIPDRGVPRTNVPCANQRLIFPELLPHVDSVLYLDPGTIILSNLTELWAILPEQMVQGEALAAMTPNSEDPGYYLYNAKGQIPHYGKGGINDKVTWMNLTRMREFSFQEKSLAYFAKYKDHNGLVEQDIYNIIFHFYPEKLLLLDCSYNFNGGHCPRPGSSHRCQFAREEGPHCFCYPLLQKNEGVRIIHGDPKSFWDGNYPFLKEAFYQFSQMKILETSAMETIQILKDHFVSLDKPCFHLTDDLLYGRGEKYLKKINQNNDI